VPLLTKAGDPFPERDLIILLAFVVIVVTLVGQGLTLGPLINRLGICDDGSEEREELHARRAMAEAALARIEELAGQEWVYDDTVERVRGMYNYRQRRFAALDGGDGTEFEQRTDQYLRVMYELFDAQREALIGLRNGGDISDEIRRKVERELDLEESRLTPR
jgi:monovalent cation/hydrogen antiporter